MTTTTTTTTTTTRHNHNHQINTSRSGHSTGQSKLVPHVVLYYILYKQIQWCHSVLCSLYYILLYEYLYSIIYILYYILLYEQIQWCRSILYSLLTKKKQVDLDIAQGNQNSSRMSLEEEWAQVKKKNNNQTCPACR